MHVTVRELMHILRLISNHLCGKYKSYKMSAAAYFVSFISDTVSGYQNQVKYEYKMERVFPMVISSEFCIGQYRDNDRREHASYFNTCMST